MAVGGLSRKIWTVDLTVIVLGLLFMAQQSLQLSLKSPLHSVVQRINDTAESYFGIVMSSNYIEQAVLASGFVFDPVVPFVFIAGKGFSIGKIKDVDVIYINTVKGGTANTIMATQILLDTFNIKGIVYCGNAGSINSSLSLGDVIVPKYVVHTGSWEWKKFESKSGKLKFGDFNLPVKGDNKLGSVDYQELRVTTNTDPVGQDLLSLPVDSTWLKTATQLQGLELNRCYDIQNCLPDIPQVVIGLNASTSDVYLKNAAYGEFLFNRFKVSTVDTTSSAIALAALSNEVPFILFSTVSNSVMEGKTDSITRTIAAANVVKVAFEFISRVSKASKAYEY